MRIYVMGSSQETELCKRMMTRLREAGHIITHDWVADIEKEGGANPVDMPDERAAEYAAADLDAIDIADVCWFILPETVTRGAWVEFGYVQAYLRLQIEYCGPAVPRKKTVLVSGNMKQSLFTRLATHFFATHDEALAWLLVKKWS